MYQRTEKGIKPSVIVDNREKLRVKFLSLACEARIIRRQELRTHGAIREGLYLHRVTVVRRAAREAHLALGFIKGQDLHRMEANAGLKGWEAPNWVLVKSLINKYGPKSFVFPRCFEGDYQPVVRGEGDLCVFPVLDAVLDEVRTDTVTTATTLSSVSDAHIADSCHVPPPGWRCTREPGHEGPCAAVPAFGKLEDYFVAPPKRSIFSYVAEPLKQLFA